jgi:hypothetical protein
LVNDFSAKIVVAKDLVHQRPDTMDIFIADLHEDGAGLGEQITGDGEAVAEVGQGRVLMSWPYRLV